MNITLLCNAGLMIEVENQILLIDLPNKEERPFVSLTEQCWNLICEKSNNICGFAFTHKHPDHYDEERLNVYLQQNPLTPVFLPQENTGNDIIKLGPFTVRYQRIDHAPIPAAPPHVSLIIEAGGRSVYVAGDAKLDCELHKQILNGRTVDAAFWNSMYLSHEQTRSLMKTVSLSNYIYHMPPKSEADGMWRKVENNFKRYEDELERVTVLGNYPTKIKI